MDVIDENIFLTSEKFYKDVDDLVWEEDISYLEATMKMCDEKGINPEDLMKYKLICQNLKDKLREDGIEMGCLKPESMLPL